MSAIYLDQYGWPAYAEDDSTGPLPPEQVKGLERVEMGSEMIDPSGIFQFMRVHVWGEDPNGA